jgi:hypothetical protein
MKPSAIPQQFHPNRSLRNLSSDSYSLPGIRWRHPGSFPILNRSTEEQICERPVHGGATRARDLNQNPNVSAVSANDVSHKSRLKIKADYRLRASERDIRRFNH